MRLALLIGGLAVSVGLIGCGSTRTSGHDELNIYREPYHHEAPRLPNDRLLVPGITPGVNPPTSMRHPGWPNEPVHPRR